MTEKNIIDLVFKSKNLFRLNEVDFKVAKDK